MWSSGPEAEPVAADKRGGSHPDEHLSQIRFQESPIRCATKVTLRRSRCVAFFVAKSYLSQMLLAGPEAEPVAADKRNHST